MFPKVAKDSQKLTLWGSEFQRAQAKPEVGIHGPWSLDAEERKALVGTCGRIHVTAGQDKVVV